MPVHAVTTAASDPTPAAPPGDGRRRRGVASRRAILDAASRLIAEDGVGALTHRAVARAADIPLARVTYHFPKVDDLMVAAARQYLEAFDDHLRATAADAITGERSMVDVCTEVVHQLVTDGAREFLGMVEVRLALARRGRTVDDTGIVPMIESFGADRRRATAIAAAMFGFAVLAAAEPTEVERAQVRDHVLTVLGMQG
jgi:AcrR family transcriptional regulator